MSTADSRIQSPAGLANGDDPYDRYIHEQLTKTSFQVKVADLSSSLMTLLAGLLTALLLLALVDHWVLPLGRAGRWLALIAVLAAATVYLVRIVAPLLFSRINPVYAARVIEQAEPTLNNSLINFLLFRSDRAGLRAGLYKAMEQQAAVNLSHVHPETAVDYSRLIRIGYVLIAVLVACAAYTMLSPKSLFATAARVGAPWADIAAPSRVRIEDVVPGDCTVFYGQKVDVSLRCYDVYDDEPVTLYYSSADGQRERQPLAMTRTDGFAFAAVLPPDGGMEQDLLYWIEAGDAVTPLFRLTVEPAPTILVQGIEYDYPPYTGRTRKAVENQADIREVEGTRVTIRARASHPIQSAVIEFDPPETAAGDAADEGTARATVVSMETDGQDAWLTFPLELSPARTEAKHSSYQVRFTTVDGDTSQNPVLHRIEVTRDLPPEVEILTPDRDRVEIPEDGLQRIEIRAVDPDFGLTRVRLRAVAGGVDLLDEPLFDDPQGLSGQSIVQFEFQPRKLGLAAGEQAVYWATAEDNRHSPLSGERDPNLSKTRDYRIVVLPAVNQSPSPSEPEQEPTAQDGVSGQTTRPQEPTAPDPNGGEAGTENDPAGAGDEGEEMAGDQGSDSAESGGSGSGSDSASAGQSPEESGGDGSSGSGGSGDNSSSAGAGQQGTGGSESGDSGGAASEGNSGGSSSESPGGGSSGSGGGSEAGTGGGESSSAGADPGSGGTPEYGTIREEPLHDGEAFEQVMDHMKLAQQTPEGSPSGQSSSGGSDSSESPGSSAENPSDASSGSPGDNAQPGQSPNQDGGSSGTPEQPRPEQAGGGAGENAAGGMPQTPGGEQPQGADQDAAAGAQGQQQEGGQPGGGSQPRQDQNQGAGQQQDQAGGGQSGQPRGGSQPKPEENPGGGAGQSEPKQGGAGDNGESGGGQQGENQPASPPKNSPSQDQPKAGGQDQGKPKPGDGQQGSDQGQSNSKKQSDSQGDGSGDRAGGGSQGAGQGANQPGNDSAGSNSPADSGAGASSESGSGDSAARPGGDQLAEDPTNTPGSQKGYGSSSMPTQGSTGSGGMAGGPREDDASNRKAGSRSPSDFDQRGEGLPLGGGRPSAADLSGFDMTGEVPPGEEANLDYTRKATDLVLEYLRDQQDSPDTDLLNKLGWTEDQLRDFVRRWESLKQGAVEDPAKQRELDESLRTLGLRPRPGGSRAATARNDQVDRIRNAGTESQPPMPYLEKYNAFRRSTTRTGSP